MIRWNLHDVQICEGKVDWVVTHPSNPAIVLARCETRAEAEALAVLLNEIPERVRERVLAGLQKEKP